MKRQEGFALLMVSIGIVIISLSITSFLSLRASQLPLDRTQITMNKMKAIDNAIINFIAKNGRIPCPASPTAVIGSATFGLESRAANFGCDAVGLVTPSTAPYHYSGAAPTRSLGLSDEYAVDGWGNKIEYIGSTFLNKALNEMTSASTSYANYDARLIIKDANSNTIESKAAYIIISRGENGYGAFNAYSSNRNDYPPTTLPIERENLECSTSTSTCNTANLNVTYQLANSKSASDDILIYQNQDSLQTNCYILTRSPACMSNQCVNPMSPVKWGNSKVINDDSVEKLFISNTHPETAIDLSYNKDLSAFATNDQITFNFGPFSTTNAVIGLNIVYQNYNVYPSVSITANYTFSSDQVADYSSPAIGSTAGQTVSFGTNRQLKSANFDIDPTATSYKASMKMSFSRTMSTMSQQKVGWQYWQLPGLAISGSNVLRLLYSNSNFPNSTYYESTSNYLNTNGYATTGSTYYGLRQWGYINPTTSGNYTFYVACDNACELYLSSDYTANRLDRIAYADAFTNQYEFTKYASQKSVSIPLTAGNSYYFEASQLQQTGGDNFSVAWQLGAGAITVIQSISPNYNLSMVPKNLFTPPNCDNGFYQTEATLSPAASTMSADIIDLNNSYGRFVKLTLLSNQPTTTGQSTLQDVYHLNEVRFRTTTGGYLRADVYRSVSDYYFASGGDRIFQAGGLFTEAALGSAGTLPALTNNILASGSPVDKHYITQNTSDPQYVIFDLGATYQLNDMLIWNGATYYTNASGDICCPGRSVKDVRVSVSDDLMYLLFHAK